MKKTIIEFTGAPCSGKSTIAHELYNLLTKRGERVSEDSYRLNNKTDTRSRIIKKIFCLIRIFTFRPAVSIRILLMSLTFRTKVNLLLIFSYLCKKGLAILDQGLCQCLYNEFNDNAVAFNSNRFIHLLKNIRLDNYTIIQVYVEADKRSIMMRSGSRTNENNVKCGIDTEIKIVEAIKRTREAFDLWTSLFGPAFCLTVPGDAPHEKVCGQILECLDKALYKKKMKVGVITYLSSENYGSVLQAYALQKMLSALGYKAETICISEKSVLFKVLHKIYVAFAIGVKSILYREAIESLRELSKIRKEKKSYILKESYAHISNFIRKEISTVSKGRLELRRSARSNEYIAFICGSDQIWSPISVHLASYKFLKFAPKDKRIAYAPSFGVNRIPSYNTAPLKRILRGINKISIREETGKEIIKQLTGIDARLVIDPTLLFPIEWWRKHYTDERADERYIICYFLDEPDDIYADDIIAFAKVHKCKIIVIQYQLDMFTGKKDGEVEIEFTAVDPVFFVRLIDSAEYLFTNSFHGCCFAIQCSTKFVVYRRNHSKLTEQTSRLLTLLEYFDLGKRFIPGMNSNITNIMDVMDGPMDVNQEMLNDLREKSIVYLKEALEERVKHE